MNRRGFFGRLTGVVGAMAGAALAYVGLGGKDDWTDVVKASEATSLSFLRDEPNVYLDQLTMTSSNGFTKNYTFLHGEWVEVPQVRYLTKSQMARMDCPFPPEPEWK